MSNNRIKLKEHHSLGQVAQAGSCTPKGYGFNSRPGHILKVHV